jgi:hypothetical protein
MNYTKSSVALKAAVKLRVKGGFQDEWIREVYLEIAEASQVIGTATLYVIDADDAEAAAESMYVVCDGFDQNTYNCGDAVYEMAGRVNEFRPAVRRTFNIEPWDSLNVLLLSQVEIGPSYRGRKIGLTVLSRMIRRWGKGCTLAVMKPYPLQFCGKDAEERRSLKMVTGSWFDITLHSVLPRSHIGTGGWNTEVAITVLGCDRLELLILRNRSSRHYL